VTKCVVVRPILSKEFSSRGHVDLVDMQSMAQSNCKWIMDYQDHLTTFWPPDGILPRAKFTLRQVLRSPILAALSHGTPAAGVRQTAAWCSEWNYGTFPEDAIYKFIRQGGHHVGHRPTFLVI